MVRKARASSRACWLTSSTIVLLPGLATLQRLVVPLGWCRCNYGAFARRVCWSCCHDSHAPDSHFTRRPGGFVNGVQRGKRHCAYHGRPDEFVVWMCWTQYACLVVGGPAWCTRTALHCRFVRSPSCSLRPPSSATWRGLALGAQLAPPARGLLIVHFGCRAVCTFPYSVYSKLFKVSTQLWVPISVVLSGRILWFDASNTRSLFDFMRKVANRVHIGGQPLSAFVLRAVCFVGCCCSNERMYGPRFCAGVLIGPWRLHGWSLASDQARPSAQIVRCIVFIAPPAPGGGASHPLIALAWCVPFA